VRRRLESDTNLLRQLAKRVAVFDSEPEHAIRPSKSQQHRARPWSGVARFVMVVVVVAVVCTAVVGFVRRRWF
jgi:hypothetical protein